MILKRIFVRKIINSKHLKKKYIVIHDNAFIKHLYYLL